MDPRHPSLPLHLASRSAAHGALLSLGIVRPPQQGKLQSWNASENWKAWNRGLPGRAYAKAKGSPNVLP